MPNYAPDDSADNLLIALLEKHGSKVHSLITHYNAFCARKAKADNIANMANFQLTNFANIDNYVTKATKEPLIGTAVLAGPHLHGFVVGYDPDKKLYRVSVNNKTKIITVPSDQVVNLEFMNFGELSGVGHFVKYRDQLRKMAMSGGKYYLDDGTEISAAEAQKVQYKEMIEIILTPLNHFHVSRPPYTQ